jgi:hypothetical protein
MLCNLLATLHYTVHPLPRDKRTFIIYKQEIVRTCAFDAPRILRPRFYQHSQLPEPLSLTIPQVIPRAAYIASLNAANASPLSEAATQIYYVP